MESIIRNKEHSKNFTIIHNDCFRNSALSMQAMGLFAYLMTLPDDWVICKKELVNHFKNGRDAVLKAFDELVDNGYIIVEKQRSADGRFDTNVYKVYEVQQSVKNEEVKQESDNGEPVTENPYTDNPCTENPSLLNTNKQRTNKQNTNTNFKRCVAPLSAKPKTKTKTSKDTSQESLEFLNSINPADKQHSEVLTKIMFESFKKLDPNYNRRTSQLLEWQVDFAKFLINSRRSFEEITASLNYALNSRWINFMFKPENFFKNYEKIFRQSVSNVNPTFDKKPQTKLDGKSDITDDIDYFCESDSYSSDDDYLSDTTL